MKNAKRRMDKIIKYNRYMVLATASRTGIPWISPLYFASSGRKKFYWYSPAESRHSKYIKKNPRVAITIFDSRAKPEEADAVYLQARARELRGRELPSAMFVYAGKYLSKKKDKLNFLASVRDFIQKSPLRMYVAEVEKAWVLGPGVMYKGKYLDSREEVELTYNL